VWRFRTGAPWLDVPERFGPWNTGMMPLSPHSVRDRFSDVRQECRCQSGSSGRGLVMTRVGRRSRHGYDVPARSGLMMMPGDRGRHQFTGCRESRDGSDTVL